MARYIHWKRWIVGLFCLGIMVWMTWFFGYTYIRMVTQSKKLTNPTPSVQEQSETRLNLSGLEFWTCQIGVFNSEENASRERGRLEKLGWEAHIISKNPWIVGVGFALSQDELTFAREQLKEGGIVSVPKQIKLPERAYRIRGAGAEQTARILEAVHLFLKTPFSSRENVLARLEKELVIPSPKGLSGLQEAGLLVIKAERTLQPESRRIVSLRLLAQYQATLDTLQNSK
jgi:hypothetical protein